MTFEELKKAIASNDDLAVYYAKQINFLNEDKSKLIDQYANEHKTISEGSCVVLADSHSKHPRKYYVLDTIGVAYNTFVDIRHHISTKNGVSGNGGYGISEELLRVVNE